ncbi:hypothetical protein GJV26_25815 [Massilia dura]|uniref:Uncharacterized protein n=1 Tax=Pseudoduganella dura TaxID=321982 RepID=A0A6I3XHE1_9BURK|nr:hypothetical protein [Pseudoduganella dura]MUI15849.1 hypothetical protein [Pseudoduganella dura]
MQTGLAGLRFEVIELNQTSFALKIYNVCLLVENEETSKIMPTEALLPAPAVGKYTGTNNVPASTTSSLNDVQHFPRIPRRPKGQ